MSASHSTALFSTVPSHDYLQFWQAGRFQPQRVVRFLHLSKEEVARLAGTAVSSVRFDRKAPRDLIDRLTEIGVTCTLVAEFFVGNAVKSTLWFKTRNPLLGDVSPGDMIRTGRHDELRRYVVGALKDTSSRSGGPQRDAEAHGHADSAGHDMRAASAEAPGATKEISAYYSARAGEYDRIYAKPERQTDLRAMERWLPPLLSGRTVLEIACGTAYWTQFVAPVARYVIAIDAAPEPLAIARKRIRNENVTFLLGDAYRLPSDLGTLNAAFAGFWLSHVPRSRQREFLLQLRERLEPRSPVIFLDNLYIEGSSTPVTERDHEGNTYQLRTLDDGSAHRVLKNFPTERELRSLVMDVGDSPQFTRWQYYWGLTYLTPQK